MIAVVLFAYRVIEPIKYGHDHFGVGAQVHMQEELGEPLVEAGVLEPWPETDEERAERLKAELVLQSDLQRAERDKAEAELAEKRRIEREQIERTARTNGSNAAAAQLSRAGGSADGTAQPAAEAEQDTSQQKAGSDDASPSASRDAQDAASASADGTGAAAKDATVPKSESMHGSKSTRKK